MVVARRSEGEETAEVLGLFLHLHSVQCYRCGHGNS